MAFGKATEVKRIKNAVLEDKLWRTRLELDEQTTKNWKTKWDWILEEYANLHQNLQELSKDSAFLSGIKGVERKEDKRSILPIPETTNHEYGWLLSKPDFRLDNLFGPDVDKPPPLPSSYRILHD